VTSLISWIGIDQRGPASVYIASDSRITWGYGAQWDFGRKVFIARKSPQLFGYCGDVAFPSQALGQLTSLIDSDEAFPASGSAEDRLAYITTVMTLALANYPLAERRTFSILYAARLSENMAATFDIHVMNWSMADGWTVHAAELPANSDVVVALGTGADDGTGRHVIQDAVFEWNQTEARDTSRAVFGAFCDAIKSYRDPNTGGPPQLIGLYRIGPPREFGVIWNDRLYLNGMRAAASFVSSELECRNETFERCSPVTRRLLEEAQRQPRPHRL